MPKQIRYKTNYPGVYYVDGMSVADGKPEKIYYIYYRKQGKQIEEPVGRQRQDDMTPARASQIRALKINQKENSNREHRKKLKEDQGKDSEKWTLGKLWEYYKETKSLNKSLKSDSYIYFKHLDPLFGAKWPEEIEEFEVDKLKGKLEKEFKPQTVKYILSLLIRICNFGKKKKYTAGLSFTIEKPKVNNVTTEDLTQKQLSDLLEAIEADSNIQAGNIMKMALFTGMRRGELFNLKWSDINYERGFINIRDPKGGTDSQIPLNSAARELLSEHPRSESEYVFPGRGGNKRVDIIKQVNRIKKRAGLPKNFRAMHGLRHAYASMLASSGQVDLYTLQKLLTHKNPQMTQRYAHLRDETLSKASELAADIVNQAKPKDENKNE